MMQVMADIDTSDVQVLIVHNKLDYISKLTYQCRIPILMGDTSSIRAHFTASHVKFTKKGGQLDCHDVFQGFSPSKLSRKSTTEFNNSKQTYTRN